MFKRLRLGLVAIAVVAGVVSAESSTAGAAPSPIRLVVNDTFQVNYGDCSLSIQAGNFYGTAYINMMPLNDRCDGFVGFVTGYKNGAYQQRFTGTGTTRPVSAHTDVGYNILCIDYIVVENGGRSVLERTRCI